MPIRELALQIVANIPNKDFRGEVVALHQWVQGNIRYTRDVYDVETLQTPLKTLEYRQGDCDDHATLLASLLLAVGHPVRFVAIGYQPGVLEHVFLETCIGDTWEVVETTEPWAVGEAHRSPVEKAVLPI